MKVNFGVSLLCRHFCPLCFFPFVPPFPVFFFPSLLASPRVLPGETTFVEPLSSFLPLFSSFSLFPLEFSLLLPLASEVFSLGEPPLPLPLWILSLSSPWPAPTREAQASASDRAVCGQPSFSRDKLWTCWRPLTPTTKNWSIENPAHKHITQQPQNALRSV